MQKRKTDANVSCRITASVGASYWAQGQLHDKKFAIGKVGKNEENLDKICTVIGL